MTTKGFVRYEELVVERAKAAAAVEDKWENARSQAQAQFESIREMVETLEACAEQGDDSDDSREAIQEDALSVEVRSDWQPPSGHREHMAPAEYRILLCTGGPAVQITGELNEHGEPETARLEMQDWFLPWKQWRPYGESNIDMGKVEEILLVYARQFYFGE